MAKQKKGDVEAPIKKQKGSKTKEVFARKLRYFMERQGLTQDQLARDLNVAQSSVSGWLAGNTLPRAGVLEALSELFHCKKSDLIEEKEKEPRIPSFSFHQIPIYDPISCGTGAWIDEQPEDYLGIPSEWTRYGTEYFANRADGDSMLPVIEPGDYLVFEQTDAIMPGKIMSVSLNGQYYCKRLRRYEDGKLWLISDNSEYDPILVEPDDDFRVLGLYKIKMRKDQ